MANLSLKVGGFGGVRPVSAPAMSTATGSGVGQMAYGSAFTPQYGGAADVLAPNDGFGLAFTVGFVCLVGLVALRWILPA